MSSAGCGIQAEVQRDAVVLDIGKRKPLIDLCKTRWAVRHNAYSHFFKYISLLALGLYTDTCDEVFKTAVWDSKSKTDASGLLTAHLLFNFSLHISCCLIWKESLKNCKAHLLIL